MRGACLAILVAVAGQLTLAAAGEQRIEPLNGAGHEQQIEVITPPGAEQGIEIVTADGVQDLGPGETSDSGQVASDVGKGVVAVLSVAISVGVMAASLLFL